MSKSNRELIDNIHCWQIEIFSFFFSSKTCLSLLVRLHKNIMNHGREKEHYFSGTRLDPFL